MKRLLLILVASFVAACTASKSSDSPDVDTGVVQDAAPFDTGLGDTGTSTDAGVDAGVDAGPDAGPSDGGGEDGGAEDGGPEDAGPFVCTNDTEGCPCTPDSANPRGSCDYTDNVCAVWDTTLNFATCVTPCSTDAECSFSDVGFACADVGLSTKICTREAVARDSVCRGSAFDGEPIVGCDAETLCLLGANPQAQSFEGVCGEPCEPTPQNPNGTCSAPYGYCNPAAIDRRIPGVGAAPAGVCTDRPRRSGNYCSLSAISQKCDTKQDAGLLTCLAIGIGSPGFGICVEFCDVSVPDSCMSLDPTFGQGECRAYDPNNLQRGLCTQPCSKYPENCTGPGGEGLGRTCVDDLVLDPNLPISFCWDITAPLLTETIGAYNGGMLQPAILGDSCGALPSGRTRCPDGLSCVAGVCIQGCDGSLAPAGCEVVTSTVTSCYPIPLPEDPNAGLCLVP